MPSDRKPPPNLAAAVEKDLTSDLKKVGGFFRGLWGATEKAQKMIRVASEQGDSPPVPVSPPRAIERGKHHHDGELPHTSIVEPTACDVCGGTRLVGGAKKIRCPACE